MLLNVLQKKKKCCGRLAMICVCANTFYFILLSALHHVLECGLTDQLYGKLYMPNSLPSEL